MDNVEIYEVEIEKFVTADLVKRGIYWYVDVLYNDGTKGTNFKFKERSDAERFLNYCFETFAESKDITKYNTLDLVLWFAIGFVTSILVSYIIDKF